MKMKMMKKMKINKIYLYITNNFNLKYNNNIKNQKNLLNLFINFTERYEIYLHYL